MHISVIYNTLSVLCTRVVIMLSPLASNSCGGAQIIILLSLFAFTCTYLTVKFKFKEILVYFRTKKTTEKEIYKIWSDQLLRRHANTCKNMKGRASEHLPKLCRNFKINFEGTIRFLYSTL